MNSQGSVQAVGRPKDQGKGAAILEAAWRLIVDRGAGAISIEAVAAEAGVSKVTVYGHFGDRSGLFEAAILSRLRVLSASRPRAPAPHARSTAEEALRAFAIQLLSFIEEEPFPQLSALLLAGSQSRSGLALSFYEAGLRPSLSELARLIETYVGETTAGSAAAAEALFGLIRGAADLRPPPVCSVERAASARVRVERGVGLFLRAYGLEPAAAARPHARRTIAYTNDPGTSLS